MAELLINGVDAATLGIHLGNGFIEAIDAPLEIKERIVSESRGEHGARIISTPVRFKPRSVSLEFIVKGEGGTYAQQRANYKARKDAFLKLLYESSPLRIQIPELGSEVFKLYYSSNTPSYALNRWRTIGKITAKFDEPNPTDRA